MPNTVNGLLQLLEVLPPAIRAKLVDSPEIESLIEVVLDYGRAAEARFKGHVERWPGLITSDEDIKFVTASLGEFGADNRAGIERTLHRISAIRNRHGRIIGLTLRVGRALEGTIDIIDDIVRSGQSILLLGKPGIGKTTKLREIARVLADEVNRRVVIVDTSNEIGGDGDIPHPAIGTSRRMQVPIPSEQHNVMIEAVENHMPEVIVIDEIGNEAEAVAARTIAERGVQLIATAHGQTLENLMLNPSLCDLIGGIQAVTLSDDEARRRGTQKTVLERKAPPTFDIVIELLDFEKLAVHHHVQKVVDLMLRGVPPRPEVRVRTDEGRVEVLQREAIPEQDATQDDPPVERPHTLEEAPIYDEPTRPPRRRQNSKSRLRIYPYGIARTRLERAIRETQADAHITSDINQADAVIAMRSTFESTPRKLRDLRRPIPTVVIKSNTFSQISGALNQLVSESLSGRNNKDRAVQEVKKAITTVRRSGKPVELSPQTANLRKVQHEIVEGSDLAAESFGQDPDRKLRVMPKRNK
ncbi:MAG: AAA family ATPase [Armatimonadetes bacterium]|nr:AAA family ATPase [Armatimonadota bacterium]